MTMPDINRRQAMVPRGAIVLTNPNGTAPGLWIERGATAIVAAAGPAARDDADARSASIAIGWRRSGRRRPVPARAQDHRPRRIGRRRAGAADLRASGRRSPFRSRTTILARARADRAAPDRAGGEPRRGRRRARSRRSRSCRTCSVRRSTAPTAARSKPSSAICCASTRLTIAVAESCTGGLLASRLTDVPGSSRLRRARRRLLQQPSEDRAGGRAGGAASRSTAPSANRSRAAMAEGIRTRAGTNVGVGITGIAGPAAARRRSRSARSHRRDRATTRSRVRTFQFIGGRDMVKFQAAQAALNMLRLMVMKLQRPREWAERR